jgi:hypothetical protein
MISLIDTVLQSRGFRLSLQTLATSKSTQIFSEKILKRSEYVQLYVFGLEKVIGTFVELGLRCVLEVLLAEGSLGQDHHVDQCASLLPSKNIKSITLLYFSHQNMSQFIQQMAEIVKESIWDWKPRGCGDANCRVSGRSSISRGGNP